MASKDDSPTSFHGQPWSVWADRLGRDSPLSDTDDQSKVNKSKEGDAMKLPKKDMTFYGLCPVRDELYLVTCNYCRRVCTPQGLKSHIGSKHAQEWTSSCNQQVTDSVDSCVSNAGTANVISAGTLAMPGPQTNRPKAAKKGQTTAALPTSLAFLLATPAVPTSNGTNNHRSRGNGGNKRTAGKTAIPTPLSSALAGTAYDKIPSPQQPPPPPTSLQGSSVPIQFSPLQPTLTAPSPVSPLTCGGNVLTPSPAITMTVAVDSSGNQTVQIHLPELGNGVTLADSPTDVTAVVQRAIVPTVSSTTKKRKNSSKADGTSRRLLPLKERELDLEKHCGVWIGDDNRACTRSLTCKAHSLTLRRNVQGRSRSFDDLLAEHRATKELVTKQLKEGTTGATQTAPSLPQGAATKTATVVMPPTGVHQHGSSKLGRPPISRAPPAKKLLTSLLQQQQSLNASELAITVDFPPAVETLSNLQVPASSGLLQRAAFPSHLPPVSSQDPVCLTFTPHHPKPLAVCSFGLRRRQVLGVVTTDRKWDFLRTTMRSALMRPTIATTSKAASVHRSGPQSLLRPSLVTSHQNHHNPLLLRESNSIELPNGLQLSIGVQPEGHDHGHHRVRLKKNLINGLSKSGHCPSVHQSDLHHSSDDMEGFDGLVGEDGVLTFLNQTEGTASLSLMADLSAGNITFSELNNHHHPAGTVGGTPVRLLPSTAAASSSGVPFQLLQTDPGDFM